MFTKRTRMLYRRIFIIAILLSSLGFLFSTLSDSDSSNDESSSLPPRSYGRKYVPFRVKDDSEPTLKNSDSPTTKKDTDNQKSKRRLKSSERDMRLRKSSERYTRLRKSSERDMKRRESSDGKIKQFKSAPRDSDEHIDADLSESSQESDEFDELEEWFEGNEFWYHCCRTPSTTAFIFFASALALTPLIIHIAFLREVPMFVRPVPYYTWGGRS